MTDGEQQNRSAAELGHWEGRVFHYNEPVILTKPDGTSATVERIDLGRMQMGDGITYEEVVEAIANNILVEDADEEDQDHDR